MNNKKKTNIGKAGLVLSIILALFLAGTPSYANEIPLYHRNDNWTMMVENTTAYVGDISHVIQINGTWLGEMESYSFLIYYDNTMIEITEINADGCVGEGSSLNAQITDFSIRFSAVLSNPVPAGGGKLANLVVNITGGPGVTELDLIDSSMTWYNYYTGLRWPTLFDGHIIIFDQGGNDPPEEPEITGPSEGVTGIAQTFTIIAEDPDGDDLTYQVDWGDNTSDEYGPHPSGEAFEVEHIWNDVGSYTIEVTAIDVFLAKSPIATHDIEIIASPDLAIESIEGGKGITVVVANDGNGNASGLDVTITIEGGLLLFLGEYEYQETLAAGESVEINMSVVGIGLGIFTPMPEITVTAECAEGSTAEETAEATVLFSTVTLQE